MSIDDLHYDAVSADVARMGPTLDGMRKPNPDRTYAAQRAGVVARLTGCGTLPDRAEALVAAWEAEAGDPESPPVSAREGLGQRHCG